MGVDLKKLQIEEKQKRLLVLLDNHRALVNQKQIKQAASLMRRIESETEQLDMWREDWTFQALCDATREIKAEKAAALKREAREKGWAAV